MKIFLRFSIILGFFLISPGLCTFSQVAISTDDSNADGSAMLDVKSTNKGVLIPRMTRAQLNAISTPAEGLMVYCTDCGTTGGGILSIFMAGAWKTLTANCLNPLSPATGTHIPLGTQIIWNWNSVSGATGYKWNTTNDYALATDVQHLWKFIPCNPVTINISNSSCTSCKHSYSFRNSDYMELECSVWRIRI
jgi:hypothetical protein